MSEREQVIQLLSSVPDYKIGYIISFIKGFTADEEADDAFCEALYQRYLDDDDPEKDSTYTLEECEKEWGMS